MTDTRWGVFKIKGDVHVVPLGDKHKHAFTSDCRCSPIVEVIGANLLVVHNAFDFRDVREWMESGDDDKQAS